MVPAKKLVRDFIRKSGMSFSGRSPQIQLTEIIGHLNESQQIVFKALVREAEKNPQVREDLRAFEVKGVCVDCKEKDSKICVASLPSDLYQRLNQKAIACHPECCGDIEKEIIIRINQSDDINESRQNPFRKADFAYEQLNGDEGSEGLYVYHEGEMEIKKVCFDYYRKPSEIHAPSLAEDCEGDRRYYDYCGQVIDQDQDFEVDCRFLDQIVVNVAVVLQKLSAGGISLQEYQAQLQALITFNSITF